MCIRDRQYLTERQNFELGEERTLKDTNYELLVVCLLYTSASRLRPERDRGAPRRVEWSSF